MTSLTLAFDDNLGYPDGLVGHLEQTVAGATGRPTSCDTLSFHDLGAMIDAFTRDDAQLMFLPCGCLPSVGVPLKVVAQATTGDDRSTSLTSVLVAGAATTADSVASAAGLRFGCINRYCTTSYWAPQFLAREHGTTVGSLTDPVWVGGFDDLVASLTDGRADAAMVWRPYLERHPDVAGHLRELGREADLPAPMLVARPTLDAAVLEALDAVAPFAASGGSLFNGLAAPDLVAIGAFIEQMEAVQPDIAVATVT